MPTPPVSQLGHVLLGLLHQEPRSGYDLRRAFADTPLRHFSDSPGAIYPALRRLEQAGLIHGTLDRSHPRRPRQEFRLTPRGEQALRRWLEAPPVADDLMRDVGAVVLRVVFIPPVLGEPAGIQFLAAFERLLESHLATLSAFHAESRRAMPLAGRLGLENGIASFTTHLAWCRRAQATLRRAYRRHD